VQVAASSQPGSDRPNEDYVAVGPDMIAVLDGATARTGTGCVHGVAWYARHLADAIIGRPDLLTDPRFSDPAKAAANGAALAGILYEAFSTQPMAHWREVFEQAHITFGDVKAPADVINDPQLRANDIVVPLEGAGNKVTSTISSPMQVRGVAKVPAKRAPELGEHTDEVLRQLGFASAEIEDLRAGGAVSAPRPMPAVA